MYVVLDIKKAVFLDLDSKMLDFLFLNELFVDLRMCSMCRIECMAEFFGCGFAIDVFGLVTRANFLFPFRFSLYFLDL